MSPPSVRRALTWLHAADAVTLEAAARCVITAAALRWRGPTGLARLRPARSRHHTSGDPADAEHIVEQVDRVARHLRLRSPCLVRSTTTQHLLARRGMTTDLRVGVRRVGGALDAHAWLEMDGVILNDTPANCAAYTAFADPIELAGRAHIA